MKSKASPEPRTGKTDDVFRFVDELGPEKIIHIHQRKTGLKAIVVIDNVATGPAIGGTRMALDVTVDECFRLARAMTLKSAAAGLPHGGGKSVIVANPKMPPAQKEQIVRSFACAIADLKDYIPGPDMGTDEECMAWIQDEIGRSVGLPPEIGGIPLDVIGATGFGLSVVVDVACEYCDLKIDGARVAVQGFGSVGKHAARFLSEKGAVLVAAADSRATVADPNGLALDQLLAHKNAGGSLADYAGGEIRDRDHVIEVECDIWIPAARPDVIRAGNVDRLNAKLVVQGANIPVTADADARLHERGILSVPDFIANAGGVICAAVEYAGGIQSTAFQVIEEKIRANTEQVLSHAKESGELPRTAAVRLAEDNVRRAMTLRRWG